VREREPAPLNNGSGTRSNLRMELTNAFCVTALTPDASTAKIYPMAHTFLICDFGRNEDAAQQARHRIEGWRQGYRLDKKLQVKFERKELEGKPLAPPAEPAKDAKSGAKKKVNPESKSGKKEAPKAASPAADSSKIRLIVRLDFSDHEKLSHQRWTERIPVEEPFKTASLKIVRAGEPEFKATSDLFDSLD